MKEKLKSTVNEKVNIEKYGFTWLDELQEPFEHHTDIAEHVLSHKLRIVLTYHQKEEQYYIYFDHIRLNFKAELSDDFFNYLYTHYMAPAHKIGVNLSEDEYSKRRVEFKDAFSNLTKNISELKIMKEYAIFLGEDDWWDFMTYLENCMLMNPMLTPHASLMRMGTVLGGDFTASCTQASTAQFYIDAASSDDPSSFYLVFTYYPDKSKYNPVPGWVKRYDQLAAVPAPMPEDLPKDLPIDVFGALFYLFGTP